MPALDSNALQQLKQQLDSREAVLREEVRDEREELANEPARVNHETVEDFGEQGEERMRTAVRYAEEERDIEELRDIEEARERIGAGTYGSCVDCGTDIPLQRLQAQPTAKRCIACQEKFERSHPAAPRYPTSL